MFFINGRNCCDNWKKTCYDVVTIGTKRYVTVVISIEYQRIDFELGKKVLFQGLQLL